MSNLTDRVSYIKGLAEGMKLETETAEGKILAKVLELLEEMAKEHDALVDSVEELNEYVESIDEDLSDIEETLFEDEDDDDECDCDCGSCGCHCDDAEEDDRVVQYACPHCGEEMTFEVDNFDFDEDYLCPNCHEPLFAEDEDMDDDEEEEEDD